MLSLLDFAIDSTPAHEAARNRSGPSIVSENHDVNAINWVAGLTDPGEMIACGYLPQLRRLSGENDADYLKRITPIMATVPQADQDRIKAAALDRVGVDTHSGRVNLVYTGKKAWHELGTQLSEAFDSATAARLSGIDRLTIDKTAVRWFDANGQEHISDSTFVLTRRDTGEELGSCGTKYRVIQPMEQIDFMDELMREFGAKYHSAGILHNGAKVFVQIELPQYSFELVRGDSNVALGTFTNRNDNGGTGLVFPTGQRIVCWNTYRIAQKDGRKGIKMRHSGNIRERLNDARRALGISIKEMETYKEHAEVLVRTPLADPLAYFNSTLDEVCDLTAAEMKMPTEALAAAVAVTQAERDAAAKRIERQKKDRNATLSHILELYHSPTNNLEGMKGTAWAGVNAVTEHTSHAGPNRKVGTQQERNSRRWDSVTTGDMDDMNQVAMTKALALAN